MGCGLMVKDIPRRGGDQVEAASRPLLCPRVGGFGIFGDQGATRSRPLPIPHRAPVWQPAGPSSLCPPPGVSTFAVPMAPGL